MINLMEREFDLTDEDFKFIQEYVLKNTGIVLADHKRDMVYARLAGRLQNLSFSNFKQYCDFLRKPNNNDETTNLVNAITTNLTFFFRESHHFDHLGEYLQELSQKQDKIRIWSAGCSTGQEPYTLSIVAHENIKNIDKKDIKILATDIDTEVLSKGAAGKYTQKDIENLDEKYIRHYFHKREELYEANELVKKIVSFKKLNLLDQTWPMKGPFDVIFCRNVVIYFDKTSQENLFNHFSNLLSDTGFLYIGHSENLFKVTDKFTAVGRTIYKKVGTS